MTGRKVTRLSCWFGFLTLRSVAGWMSVAVVTFAGCLQKTSTDNAGNHYEIINTNSGNIAKAVADLYPDQPAISSVPFDREHHPDSDSGKFVLLDPATTGIDFDNIWNRNETNFNCLDSYLIVNGVAIGDYNNDGLPDIFLARERDGGRLYRNLGGMRFEDMTTSAGINPEGTSSVGAAFVDLTNDGHLDLYVYCYGSPNRLYVNDKRGYFTEQAAKYGLDYNGASVCATYGDYDGDGDVDVYLVTNRLYPPKSKSILGAPTFTSPTGKVKLNPEYRETYYLLNRPDGSVQPERGGEFDHLYRNDGDKFVDVSVESNIGEFAHLGLSANWWDFDNDGRLDLHVANDLKGPDHLYRNNGPNSAGQITFSDVLQIAVPHTPWFSMGSDFVDINQDGLVDYFASDMAATNHYRDKLSMGAMSGANSDAWFLNWTDPPQYIRNCFYINTGHMRFMEVAALSGLASSDWTWTVKFDDFDNDGRDDVYFTNGMSIDSTNGDLRQQVAAMNLDEQGQGDFWWSQPRYELDNMAFRNLGDLKFESVGANWGLDHRGVSTGAATADLDGDGDLDIVVNGFGESTRIYRNEIGTNNSIKLRFRGSASNRDGLGVRAELDCGSDLPVQTKWMAAGRGFASSSDLVMHFGTKSATEVRRLTVRWPSGAEQVFENLPVNRMYTIIEKGESLSFVSTGSPGSNVAPSTMFESSPAFRGIQHIERDYDDFEREPLLPNKHSQLGPGLAWGDVDNDGDQDFWISQGAGRAGQLFVNLGDGKFRDTRQKAFSDDSECEDMGAALVDVDQDGDLDLYVVSGGVECNAGDAVLSDRLYLNNGKGEFSDAPLDSLPELRNSGGVVAPMDFDRDGDIDLFVGSRIIPGAYPATPESVLLVNENGRFVDATDQLAPELKTAGMVTSAVWADVNDDGWQDLVVSYDWGSPRLFINQHGQLVDSSVAAGLTDHPGWFTSVSAGDIDNDGDVDFVVGNFGLNTKYKATPEKPELLFYGDFEHNGKKQIVEAKYENGVCLPRRGLGCSSHAMPTIKEKLPTYHEFAISSLTDIYTTNDIESADKFHANYLTSCLLINTGTSDGVPLFEYRDLPRIVQVSPVFGSSLVDVDGDGNLDLYVVQNFHGPQRETGKMDGGVSLLLRGDGTGSFDPVWPNRSGLLIGEDAKALTVVDLNQDQRPDFVVSVNNGNPVGFVNRAKADFVSVSLDPGQNRSPLGSRISFQKKDGSAVVMHLFGGGSYLSQSPSDLLVPAGFIGKSIEIRWPDGSGETFQDPVTKSGKVVLRAGEGSERLVE